MEQISSALTVLGFSCQPGESPSEVRVTAPYWRSDIHLAVDLIEEIARVTGYEKLPTTMLSQPIPKQDPPPLVSLKQKARQGLTGYGFQEVITYSLTSLELLQKLLTRSSSFEPMPHVFMSSTA